MVCPLKNNTDNCSLHKRSTIRGTFCWFLIKSNLNITSLKMIDIEPVIGFKKG